MNVERQAGKAQRFRELHHGSKLLVLPNIWDPIGAILLQSLGFPAVATASAAVAYSLGFDDGEAIEFETMLAAIARIAGAVDVPVTADIERGYAATADGVRENVMRVIQAGAVGINIEDGLVEGGELRDVDEQCDRIVSARRAGVDTGVPIVINARIDCFLRPGAAPADSMDECVARARAYRKAGTDCIYPIGLSDMASLMLLRAETKAPINVYAPAGAPSMRELEDAGIRRLSLGPGLLKASLATMKRAAEGLLQYAPYDDFTSDAVTSDEIKNIISRKS